MIVINVFKNLNKIKKHAKPVDFWTVNFSYFFSIRIVSIIKNTGITPNMVTWSSLVVCLFGASLMVLFPQEYTYWLIAAILYQFSYILDCVDGQLARFKEHFSLNGWRIDLYTDRIKEFLIMLVMTYVLTLQYNWFWIVGIITMALQDLFKYVNIQEVLKSTNINFKNERLQISAKKILRRKKHLKKISAFKEKYNLGFMNIGEFYFFNFIFIILGKLDWFFYILIIYSLFSLIYKLLLNINNEIYIKMNVNKFLKDDKKLVLFGTGSGGRKIMFNLFSQNIDVAYVSDNNEEKWGKSFFGLKINEPEHIRKDKNGVNVLIASTWGYEIKQQLLSYGLDESQVISLYN